MVGSIRSLRNARNHASVRSLSALARRLKPTTSAASIAASLRVSLTVQPPPAMTSTKVGRNHQFPDSISDPSGREASPQQVLEMGDQRRVRRRHRVASQVLRARPFQRLAVEWPHKTLPPPADIERHQEVEVFVGVAREGERGEAGRPDLDAELLAEFADKRVLRPLARIDLAAGKLPQALERLALGPLRDQHPPVDVDEGGRDDYEQPHER